MFAFVSAFPKSLHCTDEAQQAETVLSAVLSIYIWDFESCHASVTKLATTPVFLSWPSGLAVTICDNRTARR